MPVEYWLQKKSLSGWSMVTWYGAAELPKAIESYKKCIGNGMSGYSWRLCKVEAIETSMLEEVTEIEAPIIDPPINPFGWDSKLKSNGWGDPVNPINKNVSVTVSNSWSDIPSDSSKPEHGLTGSVWVINHALKEKKRIPASEVDNMLALGYERGGPKTKFRE